MQGRGALIFFIIVQVVLVVFSILTTRSIEPGSAWEDPERHRRNMCVAPCSGWFARAMGPRFMGGLRGGGSAPGT